MAVRMTEREFAAYCASRNLSVTVQAGKGNIEGLQKEKAPKYRNRKVFLYSTGVASRVKDARLGTLVAVYDSEKEYRRYNELKLLEQQGLISGLCRQVELRIQDACERWGQKVNAVNYIADFCYIEDEKEVVEDVKGFDKKTGKYIMTKDFKLKWKLLQYRYPEKHFRVY